MRLSVAVVGVGLLSLWVCGFLLLEDLVAAHREPDLSEVVREPLVAGVWVSRMRLLTGPEEAARREMVHNPLRQGLVRSSNPRAAAQPAGHRSVDHQQILEQDLVLSPVPARSDCSMERRMEVGCMATHRGVSMARLVQRVRRSSATGQ